MSNKDRLAVTEQKDPGYAVPKPRKSLGRGFIPENAFIGKCEEATNLLFELARFGEEWHTNPIMLPQVADHRHLQIQSRADDLRRFEGLGFRA